MTRASSYVYLSKRKQINQNMNVSYKNDLS